MDPALPRWILLQPYLTCNRMEPEERIACRRRQDAPPPHEIPVAPYTEFSDFPLVSVRGDGDTVSPRYTPPKLQWPAEG